MIKDNFAKNKYVHNFSIYVLEKKRLHRVLNKNSHMSLNSHVILRVDNRMHFTFTRFFVYIDNNYVLFNEKLYK